MLLPCYPYKKGLSRFPLKKDLAELVLRRTCVRFSSSTGLYGIYRHTTPHFFFRRSRFLNLCAPPRCGGRTRHRGVIHVEHRTRLPGESTSTQNGRNYFRSSPRLHPKRRVCPQATLTCFTLKKGLSRDLLFFSPQVDFSTSTRLPGDTSGDVFEVCTVCFI